MQNSRSNVVKMNRFGRTANTQQGELLNECGEIMAIRLGDALGKTMNYAADELLELTDQIMGMEMRRLYDETREFSRRQQETIDVSFKQAFYQRFKHECRRGSAKAPATGEVDMAQLSLMEPDDLEESLASSNIANAINNVCGEELFGLVKRIGVLLDDPEMVFGENPIGPEIIGSVIMDVLKDQDASVKIRLLLVPFINKSLPQHVRVAYQEINRHLVDKGVLPTIRVGKKRSAASGTDAPRGKSEHTPDAIAPSATEEPGLFAMLQQLMSMSQVDYGTSTGTVSAHSAPPTAAHSVTQPAARSPQSPAAALHIGNTAENPAATVPAIMGFLTQLQREHSEGAVHGPEVSHLGNGQINVLREIKSSAVAEGMGQMDVITLDIVAMVFDYILDDRRVPDAMKALIGRLQIPVLKTAMLDQSFFSHKSHPTRRLLDMLAEASMGWDEEEGHNSGLYKKVDELVQRVLNEFDEQLDIFTQVLDDFETYLKEEKERIAATTGKSAQVIQQREQREIAQAVAMDMVQSHLFGRTAPELIRTFLFGHWAQVLASIHSGAGEGSLPWQQAIATMEDLIWSVTPKSDPEDRKQLISLLPRLLKRLDEGMRSLGLLEEERNQFYTRLVRCHAVAVKAAMFGMNEEDKAALGMTTPTETVDDRKPVAAVDEAPKDFEPVTLPEETVEADPSLIREIADEPERNEDIEEITLSDVHWLAGGDWHETDAVRNMVRSLKRGTWIEFQQEDGPPMRAKLAWTSPLKGIYLFTNRLGQRAMSIKIEGLSEKFQLGQAKLIDNVPLMDRAVNSLLERLKNNPAAS